MRKPRTSFAVIVLIILVAGLLLPQNAATAQSPAVDPCKAATAIQAFRDTVMRLKQLGWQFTLVTDDTITVIEYGAARGLTFSMLRIIAENGGPVLGLDSLQEYFAAAGYSRAPVMDPGDLKSRAGWLYFKPKSWKDPCPPPLTGSDGTTASAAEGGLTAFIVALLGLMVTSPRWLPRVLHPKKA